jgi:hypothetical protein
MRAPPPRVRRGLRNCASVPSLLIFLLFRKLLHKLFHYQPFSFFPDRGLLLTWTWTAPHVLPDRRYISRLRRKP